MEPSPLDLPALKIRLIIAHPRRRGPLSFSMRGNPMKLPTRIDPYLPQYYSREMTSVQSWRDAAEQLAAGPNHGGMFAYAHWVRADLPAGPEARVDLDPSTLQYFAAEPVVATLSASPSDPDGTSTEASGVDANPGEQESAASAEADGRMTVHSIPDPGEQESASGEAGSGIVGSVSSDAEDANEETVEAPTESSSGGESESVPASAAPKRRGRPPAKPKA